MGAPQKVMGLCPVVDAIQEAYRNALRIHNWNDWEDEQYASIETALRDADRRFSGDNAPLLNELAMWKQVAQQERAAAESLRATVATLIAQRPRTTPPPFLIAGELDADGVTPHFYQDGPREG